MTDNIQYVSLRITHICFAFSWKRGKIRRLIYSITDGGSLSLWWVFISRPRQMHIIYCVLQDSNAPWPRRALDPTCQGLSLSEQSIHLLFTLHSCPKYKCTKFQRLSGLSRAKLKCYCQLAASGYKTLQRENLPRNLMRHPSIYKIS